MNPFTVIAILVTFTALLNFINHKWLRLPSSVALMLMTLAISLVLIVLSNFTNFGYEIKNQAASIVTKLEFRKTILQVMLGFLLFAGALRIDLSGLVNQRWLVTVLATIGVLISTAVVGVLMWLVLKLVGTPLPLTYTLVFGALISPTDPIAVLHTLRRLGVSRDIEMAIAGESLFNDGVGVVVFTVLLSIVVGSGGGAHVDVGQGALLFLREAGGGLAFGLAAGYATFLLLRLVDNYVVEIFLTLALSMGGFALAQELEISGPLAMVVAGLLIGNTGKNLAMSEDTIRNLDTFWELVDEFLTALLFVLIGLEALEISFTLGIVIEGLLAIPVVIIARFFSVGAPLSLFVRQGTMEPRSLWIMVWGGMKGGLSVAMALTVPPSSSRDVLVVVTYAVVVFSIIVQGLTIGPFVQRIGMSGAGNAGRGRSADHRGQGSGSSPPDRSEE